MARRGRRRVPTRARRGCQVSLSPQEALLDNYKAVIDEPDLATFQHTLDLKGVRRNEQLPLIEQFRELYPNAGTPWARRQHQRGMPR